MTTHIITEENKQKLRKDMGRAFDSIRALLDEVQGNLESIEDEKFNQHTLISLTIIRSIRDGLGAMGVGIPVAEEKSEEVSETVN